MLDYKDYAKYPFLKGAANCIKTIPDLQKPIVTVIETEFGKHALDIAKERLYNAVNNTKFYNVKFPVKNLLPNEEIASFFFARALVSVPTPVNKFLIEKFVYSEMERFYRYYSSSGNKKQEIEDELQISSKKTKFTVAEYVPIASKLTSSSARWKLVNMPVSKGIVDISILSKSKFDTKKDTPEVLFFKERIKQKIRSTLPMKLDKETKAILDPIVKELLGNHYSSTEDVDYGEITESNFPPCMQHIKTMIQNHENPTHAGRFALVTFLHAIGENKSNIASIFQTVRDFDISQTMYQIENITGEQGVEAYKCPACDTLLTNGLCAKGKNSLCNKVKHPLGYYQAKHKFSLKKSVKE